MSNLKTIDVQKTQEIARRLNLKLTGWQFVQLASEIGTIRQQASQANSIQTMNSMFDEILHGMATDLQQKAEGRNHE